MNVNCSYCRMPFAISRNETLVALQSMQAENQHHYDAHCPRCRRANQIPRDRLEHSFPGWQEALAAITSAPAPKDAAPKSKPVATVVTAKTAAKSEKKPAAVKKPAPAAAKAAKPAASKAKPAAVKAKAPAAKKPAAKPAPAAKAKPAVKKPAPAKKK